MQRFLVTGATGFIGIEVSRQLVERGMRPRLMVRRPVRGLMLRNLEAQIMQADIRSPESLRRILSSIDTVIHLGARAAFEPYARLYPLPVIPETLNPAIGLEPKYPTIHDGIPAVLDDSISFYWLPSNLDRL